MHRQCQSEGVAVSEGCERGKKLFALPSKKLFLHLVCFWVSPSECVIDTHQGLHLKHNNDSLFWKHSCRWFEFFSQEQVRVWSELLATISSNCIKQWFFIFFVFFSTSRSCPIIPKYSLRSRKQQKYVCLTEFSILSSKVNPSALQHSKLETHSPRLANFGGLFNSCVQTSLVSDFYVMICGFRNRGTDGAEQEHAEGGGSDSKAFLGVVTAIKHRHGGLS